MRIILDVIWALICQGIKIFLIVLGVAAAAVIALIVLGVIHWHPW